MKNKRIILRISLLVFTGISCSLFTRVITAVAPTQDENPMPAIEIDDKQMPAIEDNVNNSIEILCEHRVALGETLACIGRGYGVIPEVIAIVNEIEITSDLEIGQVLQIPAIPWENISTGPVCPPQCIPPNWDLSITEQAVPGDTNPSVSEDDGEGANQTGGGNGGNGPDPDPPPPARNRSPGIRSTDRGA
jgi:hypothetical protein